MRSFFLLIFIMARFVLQAQNSYAINDMAADFPVKKIINYSISSSSFRQLNDRLTIIDFFGTWCVPCVKALPNLSALQEMYKGTLRVLLVSTESEDKLDAFFKKQTGKRLPVIVDADELVTSYFQPPAYPYTVIIDKNGKVIALPSPEEMTTINIEKWLAQENNISASDNRDKPVLNDNNKSKTAVEPSQNKLVQLSQDFMYAAKTGDETSGYISQLKAMRIDDIHAMIKTDAEKKAFWINLYNAYTQVSLKNDPEQYKNRGKFFSSKQIGIAGHSFSLDDIEHGILRRSKIKWSLGYFSKLFTNRIEKQLRVDKLDYRLHFALNCGAKSCPPIAFYKPENIDRQLDLATNAYLKGEVEYDAVNNTVKVPKLMSWFRRDFGGKRKIISLLKKLSIVPPDKDPKILFKDYDWSLYLKNYE